MDALKIGLETTIVGALALPWLFLVIDLFCPSEESLVQRLLPQLTNQSIAVIAGTLALALTYLLGSSLSRVAEDFLNDEDPRIVVTEDEVRTAVYCHPSDPWLVETGGVLIDKKGAALDKNAAPDKAQKAQFLLGDSLCAGSHLERENNVRQTFALEEAILLSGANTPDRVRYLHQQIVVLRGIVLDGTLATVLCVFGVFSGYGQKGRTTLGVLSILLVGADVAVTYNHFERLKIEHLRLIGQPPLLEAFLLAVAFGGLWLAVRGVVRQRPYGGALILASTLTALAIAGWWCAQIIYDQTVIYFFVAASSPLHGAH